MRKSWGWEVIFLDAIREPQSYRRRFVDMICFCRGCVQSMNGINIRLE